MLSCKSPSPVRLPARFLRTAFTLVELLVVMAIIAVLLSILLPSVQKIRQSANRTSCSNNLKQFCLALHQHAATRRTFPSAYEAPGFNPGWGWGANVLPFVEQDNLSQIAGVGTRRFGNGANPALPDTFTQTKLSLYRCPSDLGPTLNPIRLNHAMSNYRAVAGPITYPFFSENLDMGGVMFQNSKIRLSEITDGASNTLAVGECMYDENIDKRAALWAGMTGQRDGAIWISDVMWWVDEATATINGPAPQAFSSRHPNGAMFGFCDGSVRFFREGGDPNVVKWLAGRSDGRTVNPDF